MLPDGPIYTLNNFLLYPTVNCSGPPEDFTGIPVALVQAPDESTALAIFDGLSVDPGLSRLCLDLAGSVPPIPDDIWLCVAFPPT